jgi:hypothetical protein
MVASPDPRVADLVRQIAKVMGNPIRQYGLTCQDCTRPVSAGYRRCHACNSFRSQPEIGMSDPAKLRTSTADLVVPLTYAVKGRQAYRDMWGYKSGGEPAKRRLSILTALFALRHGSCIGKALQVPVSAVTMVPSLGQRSGTHPLNEMLNYLPNDWSRFTVSPTTDLPRDQNARRAPNPEYYVCEADLTGRHVVVFDDTWASGGHAQGAGRRLRVSGAAKVSVLVLARILDPGFDETTAGFVHNRLDGVPYELEICPVTGSSCPPILSPR